MRNRRMEQLGSVYGLQLGLHPVRSGVAYRLLHAFACLSLLSKDGFDCVGIPSGRRVLSYMHTVYRVYAQWRLQIDAEDKY